MERMRPVIVVGTGRCGTSSVARILSELGVYMGEGGRKITTQNPIGTWEDEHFKLNNDFRLHGIIDRQRWATNLTALAVARDGLFDRWGWKDPRTAEFAQDVADLFPDATWVRCERPEADVVASLRRIHGWTEAKALDLVRRRVANLDALASVDFHVVRLAELAEDEDAVGRRLFQIVFGANKP